MWNSSLSDANYLGSVYDLGGLVVQRRISILRLSALVGCAPSKLSWGRIINFCGAFFSFSTHDGTNSYLVSHSSILRRCPWSSIFSIDILTLFFNMTHYIFHEFRYLFCILKRNGRSACLCFSFFFFALM